VEKKKLKAAVIISALLFSVAVGTQFVNLGKANPNPFYIWYDYKEGRPEFWAKPPEISLTSPKNNTIYIDSSLNLTFSVSVDSIVGDVKKPYFIREITYEVDWLAKTKTVYGVPSETDAFSTNIYLTDIPEGEHSLVVSAIARGSYESQTVKRVGLDKIITVYGFNVSASSAVTFSVDTVSPEVSILQMQNQTYEDSVAPLNFTVSEAVSRIWYVLDGHEEVLISENVTMAGLGNGLHNVTVYAEDFAGHVGASKTAIFTVAKPEPFPTTLVIVSTITAVVFSVVLLVYFKKRKREAGG
jgi:hypothetical protein